jgi:hypothetical protein
MAFNDMTENKQTADSLTTDVEPTLQEKGQVVDISANDLPEGIHTDVGRRYFELSLQYDQAQLERDAVKVRRKLDFIVLPMVNCFPSTMIYKFLTEVDDDHLYAELSR